MATTSPTGSVETRKSTNAAAVPNNLPMYEKVVPSIMNRVKSKKKSPDGATTTDEDDLSGTEDDDLDDNVLSRTERMYRSIGISLLVASGIVCVLGCVLTFLLVHGKETPVDSGASDGEPKPHDPEFDGYNVEWTYWEPEPKIMVVDHCDGDPKCNFEVEQNVDRCNLKKACLQLKYRLRVDDNGVSKFERLESVGSTSNINFKEVKDQIHCDKNKVCGKEFECNVNVTKDPTYARLITYKESRWVSDSQSPCFDYSQKDYDEMMAWIRIRLAEKCDDYMCDHPSAEFIVKAEVQRCDHGNNGTDGTRGKPCVDGEPLKITTCKPCPNYSDGERDKVWDRFSDECKRKLGAPIESESVGKEKCAWICGKGIGDYAPIVGRPYLDGKRCNSTDVKDGVCFIGKCFAIPK